MTDDANYLFIDGPFDGKILRVAYESIMAPVSNKISVGQYPGSLNECMSEDRLEIVEYTRRTFSCGRQGDIVLYAPRNMEVMDVMLKLIESYHLNHGKK
jgi:hypothetical protein